MWPRLPASTTLCNDALQPLASPTHHLPCNRLPAQPATCKANRQRGHSHTRSPCKIVTQAAKGTDAEQQQQQQQQPTCTVSLYVLNGIASSCPLATFVEVEPKHSQSSGESPKLLMLTQVPVCDPSTNHRFMLESLDGYDARLQDGTDTLVFYDLDLAPLPAPVAAHRREHALAKVWHPARTKNLAVHHFQLS